MFGILKGSLVNLPVLAIAALVFGTSAHANENHPLSIVKANIFVSPTKLTMRLTCFAEDLELLQGVEPYEETGKYDNQELAEGTEDHAQYLLEKILIMDANGDPYKGIVTNIKGFEVPDEGIAAGQLMNFTMSYVIEYKFETPPEFITVEQKMIAEGALLPTELDLKGKQAGSDASFGKIMKPEMPETYQFDWENVPPDTEAGDEVWEQWLEKQREKNLGIESYSSVYSFIYITRREVRQEVLMPIASLSTFIDIESKDGRFLTIAEQDELKPKIEALFSQGNPVTVNGAPVAPKFDRIDFYGLDIRDFAMQSERRKISMANGRLGVIMSYPAGGIPQTASLTWDLFNEIVRSVDSVVIAMDEVRRTQFSRFLDNNTFEWKNEEPVFDEPIATLPASFDLPYWKSFPWLSSILFGLAALSLVACIFGMHRGHLVLLSTVLAIAGAVLVPYVTTDLYASSARPFAINDDDAQEIFEKLHRNMFRAFEYADESKIYDELAQSVDGKLLRELYLDLNESLKIKEQGGAVAVIESVDFVSGKMTEDKSGFPIENPGFTYRCQWDLSGTVEHWGHIHERRNKYDASFDVQAIEKEWKITRMKQEEAPKGVVTQRRRKLEL